jgi:Fe-S-cluster containining protein
MTEPGCNRCGQCCTSAFIGLHSIRKGEDKQEFAQWLSHHHCDPKWMRTDDGEILLVRIPLICKHLGYDKDGVASCKIYDRRPVICREHKCQKLESKDGL